ncbi:hypothetical protein PF007_g16434, partial [Phytophthora fragariae]
LASGDWRKVHPSGELLAIVVSIGRIICAKVAHHVHEAISRRPSHCPFRAAFVSMDSQELDDIDAVKLRCSIHYSRCASFSAVFMQEL